MNRDRFIAFAQLLRIPNVFTAFGDIALGVCVAAALLHSPPVTYWIAYLLIALASGCLYLAGMVWNDLCDLVEDAKSRSFRPLPSGRVQKSTAIGIGIALLLAGIILAGVAGVPGQPEWNHEPFVYAIVIVFAVLAYDGGLKRTPVGPIAMGVCRFLNVLFGLSLVPEESFDIDHRMYLAGVVGVYIVGVTWFARTEEGRSRKRDLIAAALVIVLGLVLALVLRAKLPPNSGTVAFPYLLVAHGFLVGIPVVRAMSTPDSRQVQAAVKRCVLGLIILDAVLATMFVGLPGLLIVLLLPPALWLGKWVYST